MTKKTATRQKRLEKMVTERTAYWIAKRPAWRGLAPAVIEEPLRFIKRACTTVETNEEGEEVTKVAPFYQMAKDFAEIGDGKTVQAMAKLIYNQGLGNAQS